MRLFVFMLIVFLVGCSKRLETSEVMFEEEKGKYVVTILLDMSGSFQQMMATDGKAHEFALQVIDRYFRDRIGMPDKLIIARIAGSDRALLWEGTPQQLRQDFPNPTAFRQMLLGGDPQGGDVNGAAVQPVSFASNIHQSLTRTIDYVLEEPGVSDGSMKSAVFVLSDMLDTDQSDENKKKVLEALSQYGQTGGTLGIYWCDQLYVTEWRKHLKDAGIEHAVVQSHIQSRPTLPSFE